MDIGGAFSYVFEDEDWIVKILLGAAILLIPIFGQLALVGYGIAILRNVKAGKPQPLPDSPAIVIIYVPSISSISGDNNIII